MLKIEQAFYSHPGPRQGAPTVRMASRAELMLELWVAPAIFARAAPLVDRLRLRRLTRYQYEALRSMLTENSLVTGQVDETLAMLEVVARMWRRCPACWLPDLRPLKAWLADRLDRDPS